MSSSDVADWLSLGGVHSAITEFEPSCAHAWGHLSGACLAPKLPGISWNSSEDLIVMALKVYADRMSPPARAVLIFCKVNGIDFEEIQVDILKNQQYTPEYRAINPMHQVPAIVHGRFKLFESHAILIYICCAFPGVASHWYPTDLLKRAKIHSVLDWHHCNLRRGSAGLILNTYVAPLKGFPSYPRVTKESEQMLVRCLAKLESFWLKDGRFLLGSSQPSIADLCLVCEIIQLELQSEEDCRRILGPYKKVVQWMEDTKSATAPHFDEVHGVFFNARKGIREWIATQSRKTELNLEANMALKVYVDRLSQPSRAIIIFCKVNGIDFEEIRVDIMKNEQYSPEYKAINPMNQVPAIADGPFLLFESHAILIYISSAFPGVASHWYPSDLKERAKIHSVLDWHHSNLRRGSAGLIFNTLVAPFRGLPLNPQAAKECEEILIKSLSNLETFWLKDARFLVGCSQPSIADLSLVCELMQLELLSEEDRNRILSPYKKVVQWMEDTKSATAPHFDEVHRVLFETQKGIREQMAAQSGKTELKSEINHLLQGKWDRFRGDSSRCLEKPAIHPEYKAINPMHQVPAIADGRFKLFESHAILIYISCAFPGVASHWYPGDLSKRAKIHSVLDWHHSNLRRGGAGLIFNSILAPINGLPGNLQVAKESKQILIRSLSKLETFWLKDARFLVGCSQPSIADLSLVCELMQLELLSEEDRNRILSPYKKVVQWMEDTKSATAPHFDEVHRVLFQAQKGIRERMATQSGKTELKVNGIDFEEIRVEVLKSQQYTPAYKAINPLYKVPAIADGRFKLSESHAILIYISCAFPGVASHWYPGDISKRAKIHSVLDWHHSNLRCGSDGLTFNSILAPINGLPVKLQVAKEPEPILIRSLSKLETFWLKDARFLVGCSQPSIADLSLVCELMQLELLSKEDRNRILSPYKKVVQWMEDTKSATAPHFDEVHRVLFKAQKGIREQMATQSGKTELKLKM
ncbi:hypothetical protein OSB04_009982 [Centaurea solstitialis]|uniref:glutathione transferase n=1 Tax=Centaurea solstitialis TaxID=347529 RepID=A0AA38TRI0_9ASTR|nr:hypothetical protein OSB04_009982 [Centaurea solstitialis]